MEMDKEILKERIKVLELDKMVHQESIDNSLENNNNLNFRINDLIRENKNLLNKTLKILGFNINTNVKGLSSDIDKPEMLKYILENIKKDEKILDVGFGSMVYGKLLRTFYYRNIDGLVVYDENLGLDNIYNKIFIDNILDFNFEFYDLIIMSDVLEHIELESAKKLLSGFIEEDKCDHILISIPYEYEQDEVYGNGYEKHLQPDITKEYMKKHYPYLKLVNLELLSGRGSIIANYIWNKNLDSFEGYDN